MMKTRLVAAAAVLVSAGVHLDMWFNGVRHQSVGPAFLLNFAGGLGIAALLLTWRHWAPPLLAVGFGLSTIGAFVIAATVGLFGVHDHWTGGYVWTAFISEVVAILAGTAVVWREGWLPRRSTSHHRAATAHPVPH
jgi:O-antigen/teichoic acid export membrane protein